MRKLAPTMPRERNRRTREAIEATLQRGARSVRGCLDGVRTTGRTRLPIRVGSSAAAIHWAPGLRGMPARADRLRSLSRAGEFRPDAAGDSVAILTPDTATTLGLSHEPTHYAERGTAN